MKRYFSELSGLVTAGLVLTCVFAAPLAAQEGPTNSPRFRDNDGESRGTAVPRPAPAPAPPPAAAPAPPSGGEASQAAPRDGNRNATSGGASEGSGQSRRRPREGRPNAGTAVPRESAPRPNGGNTIIVPNYGHRYPRYGYGYYPWGFGGLGFGDYYGGYYDPWYGGSQYGVYPYGGDPYGGYSSSQSGGYGWAYEGSLHLKMKPRDAQVFVDGYYVGVVDDFDGMLQRLRLEAGPHRIEVRAAGFETVVVDVRIEPDRTTTYRGELRPGP